MSHVLKSKSLLYLMAIGAIVAICLAVAIFWTSESPQVSVQSSITRDNVTIEIVETAPAGLDNPNIRNISDVWLEMVKNATRSIDIEIYTIYRYTYGPIYDFHRAIYDAAARGVRVRMLIDNEIYWDNDYLERRTLMNEFDAHENIEVRQFEIRPDVEDMHSKVIIVDNEAAYVGSANQSYNAMKEDREIGLLVHSGDVARALTAIFEAGWSGDENQPGFENGWTIGWVYPVATPIKTPDWVASTEETIVGLINSAQKTVHAFVYVFSGSPYTLSSAVEDAANRGVNVQIIVDVSYRNYGVLDMLTENPNVQIKTVDLEGYAAAHAKAVVVDREKVYIGSANWTQASMRERREIGIVFEDQTLGYTLEKIFRTDWESEYATWVKEPQMSPLLFYVIGVIAAGFVIAVALVWVRRRTKKKSQKRMLRAELWASGRGEV